MNLPFKVAKQNNINHAQAKEKARQLCQAILDNVDDQCKRFLMTHRPRHDERSSWFLVMSSGDKQLMDAFVQKLANMACEKTMTARQINFLLTVGDRYNHTPLLAAMNANMDLDAYFDHMEKMVDKGLLTRNDYVHMLHKANNNGYTPLLNLMNKNGARNLAQYLKALTRANEAGWIDQKDLVDLLSEKHEHFQNSPLHQVLHKGNLAAYVLYFAYLKSVHLQGLLSQQHYIDILTAMDNKKATPLHKAAQSGHWELFALFYTELVTLLNDRPYRLLKNLVHKTDNQVMPCCRDRSSIINRVLSQERGYLTYQRQKTSKLKVAQKRLDLFNVTINLFSKEQAKKDHDKCSQLARMVQTIWLAFAENHKKLKGHRS